jgi:exodeoxyribonuclease V alpha subunit
VARWNHELRELGYQDPTGPVPMEGTRPGWIDRDAAADLVVSILGANRSAWNTADIRGKTEVLLAQTCLLADTAARIELAEDITARATDRCVRLLNRADVPEHVRSLTSPRVLEVEADLISRLAARGERAVRQARRPGRGLQPVPDAHPGPDAVSLLTGSTQLVVIEGAAGAGKTTALRATQQRLALHGHRLLVVTPTLKAAQVAAAETGAEGHSAAWLIHQHGWRWDNDGHWTRQPNPTPDPTALLRAGDLLLVDEAGMLDQDTARALLRIADETGARVAFVGDRHQLPAVGRGGVLDHAITWAHPTVVVTLEKVHRFTDPDYAALSLRMRTSDDPSSVFDALHSRGQVVIHASEAERTTALAEAGATGELVMAETRDQVTHLNSMIRDHRHPHHISSDTGTAATEASTLTTDRGEVLGVGDRVATRRNDPDLQVANRQTWTITGIRGDGSIVLHGRGRDRQIPADYVTRFVELAYATTVHGTQGETVDRAHVALDDTTGAAAAYVAMTRGRDSNTAHLVAANPEEARRQWVAAFSRDRADLGPGHARTRAIDDLDRYGPTVPAAVSAGSPRHPGRGLPEVPPTPIRTESPGIGR